MTTHGSTRPGRSALPAYLARAAALALLLVLLLRPAWLQGLFAPFADNGAPVIYDRASLLDLTLAHLGTVALSSVIGTIVAVAAGIAVTRPARISCRSRAASSTSARPSRPSRCSRSRCRPSASA